MVRGWSCGRRSLATSSVSVHALSSFLRQALMVKFGERLPQLMVRGWSQFYIDYDKLKRILESASASSTDDARARASAEFFTALEHDIRKVDSFVESQLKELRSALKAAKGSPSAVDAVNVDLHKLCRFVGTNIIAATKIVKKHDKGVPEKLQQREKVAALVMSCPALNDVPAFQTEVTGRDSPKSVAIDIKSSTTSADDDDDS